MFGYSMSTPLTGSLRFSLSLGDALSPADTWPLGELQTLAALTTHPGDPRPDKDG